jgi:hypothetical protein
LNCNFTELNARGKRTGILACHAVVLPDELKDLWLVGDPDFHPLLHGDDDGVGLVVGPVFSALLRRTCKADKTERDDVRDGLDSNANQEL